MNYYIITVIELCSHEYITNRIIRTETTDKRIILSKFKDNLIKFNICDTDSIDYFYSDCYYCIDKITNILTI